MIWCDMNHVHVMLMHDAFDLKRGCQLTILGIVPIMVLTDDLMQWANILKLRTYKYVWPTVYWNGSIFMNSPKETYAGRIYDCCELCYYGRKSRYELLYLKDLDIYICINLMMIFMINKNIWIRGAFIVKRGTWYLLCFHLEGLAYLDRYVLHIWQGDTVKQWLVGKTNKDISRDWT